MKDADEDIIGKQDAAIDVVRTYMRIQIEHLSILGKETGRIMDYMEIMQTILDNVKNSNREAMIQAVREKIRNIR